MSLPRRQLFNGRNIYLSDGPTAEQEAEEKRIRELKERNDALQNRQARRKRARRQPLFLKGTP